MSKATTLTNRQTAQLVEQDAPEEVVDGMEHARLLESVASSIVIYA